MRGRQPPDFDLPREAALSGAPGTARKKQQREEPFLHAVAPARVAGSFNARASLCHRDFDQCVRTRHFFFSGRGPALARRVTGPDEAASPR